MLMMVLLLPGGLLGGYGGGSGWGQRILGEGEHRRESSHLRARSFSNW